MILPVITLYQPWATWIMRGWKTIETRTHSRFACLNGKTILIHAGMNTDASAIRNPYLTHEQLVTNPDEMVNGFILGSASVKAYSRLDKRHSRDALIECELTERYGLHLADITRFEKPIRENGSMGIWYYDINERRKVTKPTVQTQTTNSLFK